MPEPTQFPEGGRRLPYRIYVWRDNPDDPHRECVGSCATLDDAVDMATDWADSGHVVQIDRTIWERNYEPADA